MTSFLAQSARSGFIHGREEKGVSSSVSSKTTTTTSKSLYSLLVYEQIIREVVFKKEGSEDFSRSVLPKIPTLSQYHKIQNRKLTTKQIAWTDERKAVSD